MPFKTAPFYFEHHLSFLSDDGTGNEAYFSLSSEQANFNGTLPYGDAPKDAYLDRPCRVRSYAHNGLGIYDMHGNVREWCGDTVKKGLDSVVRGGGWNSAGIDCRAASFSEIRLRFNPNYRSNNLGFRLARVPAAGK